MLHNGSWNSWETSTAAKLTVETREVNAALVLIDHRQSLGQRQKKEKNKPSESMTDLLDIRWMCNCGIRSSVK